MHIITHLDMDAFFAAIEERERPRFQGLPIVVGADPAPKQVLVRGKPGDIEVATGRGVVSTANYKAREYGIHSAKKHGVLRKVQRAKGKARWFF